MKYEGIETKELLKKSADEMLYICVAGGVLEGIGYLLYIKFHNPCISLLTILMFFAVNVMCILFIYITYFPKRLRERYKRDDVPDKYVNWAWYERIDVYLIIPAIVFPNMGFIFLLIKSILNNR